MRPPILSCLKGKALLLTQNALRYFAGIILCNLLSSPLMAGKLSVLDCSEYRIRIAASTHLANEKNEQEGNAERYTSVPRCTATITLLGTTNLSTVDILSFRSCYFSDPVLAELSKDLPSLFPNLRLLDLSWNLIGKDSAASLLKWLDRETPPFIIISDTGVGSYDVCPIYEEFARQEKSKFFDYLIFETTETLSKEPLPASYQKISLPEGWIAHHQYFYQGELGQFLQDYTLPQKEVERRMQTEMLAGELQITPFLEQSTQMSAENARLLEHFRSFLTSPQNIRDASPGIGDVFAAVGKEYYFHLGAQHCHVHADIPGAHFSADFHFNRPLKKNESIHLKIARKIF